jgi:hypothetical protein
MPALETTPAGAPAGARRHRSRVPRAPAARIEKPRELVAGVLFRLPTVRELTPAQKNVLIYLSEAILHRRGSYVEGQGELAAEVNVSRRTIIRAVRRLRELRILEATPTIQYRTGGTDKLRYRLHRSIYGLFVGCDTGVTPLPEGYTNSNLDVPAGDVKSGRPAAAEHHSGRLSAPLCGAPAAPELLAARLTARVTAALQGGRVDVLVVRQIAGSLPARYWPLAEALAEKVTHPSSASIGAPGAWIRQRLADRIRADGLDPPASWRVKPTPEAELVRLRGEPGARRSPPAASSTLRGLVMDDWRPGDPVRREAQLINRPAPPGTPVGGRAKREVDPPARLPSTGGSWTGASDWRALLTREGN